MIRNFRGIRVDNGELVYGWYMEHPFKDDPTKPLSVIVQDERPYEVIPESVGQSTGLKDKKRTKEFPDGQMIYEGDYVKGKNGYGSIATKEVSYLDGAFYPVHKGEFFWTDIEIIGDVHTHPELLEQK